MKREEPVFAQTFNGQNREKPLPSIFFGLQRIRGQRRIFTSVKNMAGTVVSTFVGIEGG